MRVIVDALAARYGGTAYAALQIAQNLRNNDDRISEVVVVARAGSLVATGLELRPRLRLVALPGAHWLELPRRVAWEAARLPGLVDHGDAVILSWSGMLPRQAGAPVLAFLANPVMFERNGYGHRLRRHALERTVRGGASVVVPTRAMGRLVEAHLGEAPQVIPLGLDHSRFVPAESPGHEILCVADFYRHKKHEFLLDLWASLPPPRPPLRLVGNGDVDHATYHAVLDRVARYRALGRITVASGLPLRDLVAAYHRARVFLLPSVHESFCLPLLEAQACGVPAIIRDLPALRETGGPGTAFVTSSATDAWVEPLERLLHDEGAHAQARQLGFEHVAGYSWTRAADAVREQLLALRERERLAG